MVAHYSGILAEFRRNPEFTVHGSRSMLLWSVGITIGTNIGKNSNQIGSVCTTLVIDLSSHHPITTSQAQADPPSHSFSPPSQTVRRGDHSSLLSHNKPNFHQNQHQPLLPNKPPHHDAPYESMYLLSNA